MRKKTNLESLKNNIHLFHEIKIKGGLDKYGNRWTMNVKATADPITKTCKSDDDIDNICGGMTLP